MLENIISKHLVDFLEDGNLFYDKQHGFRRKLSTITQLFESTYQFGKVLNARGQVDVVPIDLSKTFDRVTRTKLLEKLLLLGVDKNLVLWIKSYLSDRTKYVEIDGHASSALPVTSGVPRGSVSGPVLFLVYVNDIARDIDPAVEVRLFADDCLVHIPVITVDDQELLNDSSTTIFHWCEKWEVSVDVFVSNRCLATF